MLTLRFSKKVPIFDWEKDILSEILRWSRFVKLFSSFRFVLVWMKSWRENLDHCQWRCENSSTMIRRRSKWPDITETIYRNVLHLAGDGAWVLPVSGLCVGYTQPGGPADGQRQVGLTGGAEQQGGAVQVVPEVAGHSCDDVLKVQGRRDLEKGPEIELNVFFQFSRSIDMSVTRSTVDWFVRSDLFLTFVSMIWFH